MKSKQGIWWFVGLCLPLMAIITGTLYLVLYAANYKF